jgi:hypothetical protein
MVKKVITIKSRFEKRSKNSVKRFLSFLAPLFTEILENTKKNLIIEPYVNVQASAIFESENYAQMSPV